MQLVGSERPIWVGSIVIKVNHANCPQVLLFLKLDLPRIDTDLVLVGKASHSLDVRGLSGKDVERCYACAAHASLANLKGDTLLGPHVPHGNVDSSDLSRAGHGCQGRASGVA